MKMSCAAKISAGVVQTVIYGSRQIYRQRAVNAGLEYEFDWKADRYNPVMSLRAGADYYNRSGIGSLVFRTPVRSMSRMCGCMSVPIAISGSDAGGWKCSVELACHTGGGSPLDEGQTASSVPDMEPGVYAAGNEEYRNYEYEYLAATRGNCRSGALYASGGPDRPARVQGIWDGAAFMPVSWIG